MAFGVNMNPLLSGGQAIGQGLGALGQSIGNRMEKKRPTTTTSPAITRLESTSNSSLKR